jgi:hypothetical protein
MFYFLNIHFNKVFFHRGSLVIIYKSTHDKSIKLAGTIEKTYNPIITIQFEFHFIIPVSDDGLYAAPTLPSRVLIVLWVIS